MGAAYEDNFGFWDLDEPEELAFFHHVQRQSVGAVCKRCERIVHLMPPRIFCAPCASALECGAPLSISDYSRHPETGLRSKRLAALAPVSRRRSK